ncbi:MAG TPA: ABC transporter permease [Thermoanaerobaculia bacterium]|jgi:putative ABC transport system permease protein|nr:ABC transporter permease [Thermoanaerobaculia bacterium]
MSYLTQDIRYAVRALRRTPGFTFVALATLAVGIGANTAIFSVVDAVLLRPLPYAQPDRLVRVFQTLPKQGIEQAGASFPNYADWAERTRSFEDIGAVRLHDYTLTERGEPALVVAGTVTSSVFRVLRARPILGRTLVASDDAPGAAPVAVLTEKLWRQRFAGDPRAIGRTVTLDRRPFTVVGVMPAAFTTPPEVPVPELWTPLSQDPVFADLRGRRGGHYLTLVARLANGRTLGEAQAELAGIAASLEKQYPKENEGWGVRLVPLAESLVSGFRTALLVLLGAVALVFVIGCANIANLLLARSASRSREVAIRTALGAGRARLARQFLTECLVLSLTGGALGVALAYAGMGALRRMLPSDLPRTGEIALDARVLLFSLAASVLGALVFGLVPALQTASSGLSATLREGSAGAGESRRRRRLRSVLVVAETALSFVLLVGAGLLARSFLRLRDTPLGFDPSGVLTAGMSLPRSQYDKPAQWTGFYSSLVERLRGEPGVESVAAALPLPLMGAGLNFSFHVDGRPLPPGETEPSANYTALTTDYFKALRIPLLRGRLFSDADAADRPKVCVVSAELARRYFPKEDPIGQRLVFGFADPVSREIVGVVGDVKRDGLGVVSRPEMYVPFVQEPWWAAYLVVRTSGDPAALAPAVRAHVRALDATLPIEDIAPMTRTVYDSAAQPRFRTTLLGLFGGAALLLAALGIYGVVSYGVGRRTRELGIRVALGAQRGDVLRMILGEGLLLSAIGLAAGLAGAVVLTRYLASLLFEVGRLDPATYAAVAAVLLAVSLLAGLLPARRATRVDPVTALRQE